MITLRIDTCEKVTQAVYDSIVEKRLKKPLKCPCCKEETRMIKHGYYKRKLNTGDQVNDIITLRVKCDFCRKTHGLLLSVMVPYSQISVDVQMELIEMDEEDIREWDIIDDSIEKDYLCRRFAAVEKGQALYIRKMYVMRWEELIAVNDIELDYNCVENCFKVYGMQFMQSGNAKNILL